MIKFSNTCAQIQFCNKFLKLIFPLAVKYKNLKLTSRLARQSGKATFKFTQIKTVLHTFQILYRILTSFLRARSETKPAKMHHEKLCELVFKNNNKNIQ